MAPNFEQIQLIMAWSKHNFFYLWSIPHTMCWNCILLKVFIKKCCFRLFSVKKYMYITPSRTAKNFFIAIRIRVDVEIYIALPPLPEFTPETFWQQHISWATSKHFTSSSCFPSPLAWVSNITVVAEISSQRGVRYSLASKRYQTPTRFFTKVAMLVQWKKYSTLFHYCQQFWMCIYYN